MSVPKNQETINNQQQKLYDHFIDLLEIHPSSEVIERFRMLFIQGWGYPDSEVVNTLEKIAASKEIETEFNFILNRCCHILINRWQPYAAKKDAILALIHLFEEVENRSVTRAYGSRGGRRIAELVKDFTTSEQYLTLKRFAEVINSSPEANSNSKTALAQPLRTLIPRYPYLYKHCLASSDSGYEHQQAIKAIQQEKQREYEVNLSQYVTHRIREIRVARQGKPPLTRENASPITNPTLLKDPELFFALRQYVGKVETGYTYKDLAQRFLVHTQQPQSYRAFKDSFYEYLSTSLELENRTTTHKLNNKFYKHLQTTLEHSNDKQFNDSLMMRTCSTMLNFLVVDSPQRPQHFLFLDLLSNLGPIVTIGMLLKIVLICHQIRPYLEQRFAILFNHYESDNREAVQWLVKALENMHLALSTNLGKVDLSFIR